MVQVLYAKQFTPQSESSCLPAALDVAAAAQPLRFVTRMAVRTEV